ATRRRAATRMCLLPIGGNDPNEKQTIATHFFLCNSDRCDLCGGSCSATTTASDFSQRRSTATARQLSCLRCPGRPAHRIARCQRCSSLHCGRVFAIGLETRHANCPGAENQRRGAIEISATLS